jgi:hypothetical protein
MFKAIKEFGKMLLEGNLYKTLFSKQTPGNRIAPAKQDKDDAKAQMRLDAGEIINGKKYIYIQETHRRRVKALRSCWRRMDRMQIWLLAALT